MRSCVTCVQHSAGDYVNRNFRVDEDDVLCVGIWSARACSKMALLLRIIRVYGYCSKIRSAGISINQSIIAHEYYVLRIIDDLIDRLPCLQTAWLASYES